MPSAQVATTQIIPRDQAWEFDMLPQEPKLVVDPGETFAVECQDAFCGLIQTEDDLPTPEHLGEIFRLKTTNPTAGPIAVKGAKPGDVLVVEIMDIVVHEPGFVLFEVGLGPLADSLKHPGARGPQTMIVKYLPGPSGTTSDGTGVLADGSTWPLRPMIGAIGVVRDRPTVGADTNRTQSNFGGNIDCPEIRKGNKVMFPVAHEGGLLYLGDLHASQASEFGGTGLETRGDVTLRCEVIPAKEIPFVRIETPDAIIQLNSYRPIDEGLKQANLWMLDWLVDDYGFSSRDALMNLAANGEVCNAIYALSMWGPNNYTVGVSFPKRLLPSNRD